MKPDLQVPSPRLSADESDPHDVTPRRAVLEKLPDTDLLACCRKHDRDSAEWAAACEVLVRRFTPLVRACVRQFRDSPEPTEDLMQVGYLGLLKAIGNYDPAFGNGLRAYAVPCISGELKRHFHDKRWQVKVARPSRTSPTSWTGCRPTTSSRGGSASRRTNCARPGGPPTGSPGRWTWRQWRSTGANCRAVSSGSSSCGSTATTRSRRSPPGWVYPRCTSPGCRPGR